MGQGSSEPLGEPPEDRRQPSERHHSLRFLQAGFATRSFAGRHNDARRDHASPHANAIPSRALDRKRRRCGQQLTSVPRASASATLISNGRNRAKHRRHAQHKPCVAVQERPGTSPHRCRAKGSATLSGRVGLLPSPPSSSGIRRGSYQGFAWMSGDPPKAYGTEIRSAVASIGAVFTDNAAIRAGMAGNHRRPLSDGRSL